MAIINYSCKGTEDYNEVRQILVENYNLLGRYYSPNIGDMDFCRFIADAGTLPNMQLWKDTEANKVIGYVWWWENDTSYYLAGHHNYKFIENELLEFAEEKRKILAEDKEDKILFYDGCYEGDKEKAELLKRRGYELTEYYSSFCKRSLEDFIPKLNLPRGYYIRNIKGIEEVELKALATISQKQRENTNIDNYTNLMKESKTYKKELDLVIINPQGNFAAYAMFWFDEHNKVGILEPLAVVEKYRGLALGKNIVYEGMRRLKSLGATDLYALVDDPEEVMPYSFYKTVGFKQDSRVNYWQKNLT